MPRLLLLGFAVWAVAAASAQSPETVEANHWFDQFQAPSAGAPSISLPLSFVFDGQSSAALLQRWPRRYSHRALDAQREESTVVFSDPQTGLEIRCVAVHYLDFPTAEWTVYFKNKGGSDTPILEHINALDARWQRTGEEEFLLHHEFGTFFPLSPTDFMPQETRLPPGADQRFIPSKGRPTAGVMPYFDLERGQRSGVIVAVGWPGAWAAEFARDSSSGIRVTAGQELAHLRLHPGEEIRTPLMVLQFWRGDWIDAQNTWRRWMIAHNMPRPGGQPPKPILAGSSSSTFEEMTKADEQSQLTFMDRYREERIPLDVWWMDAGWYENAGRWQEPIAYRPDRKRFPHGLRPVSEHAHSLGLKSLVWFEPERVMPTNELFQTHPDWLLPNLISKRSSRLLYLGNPDALAWLTDLISRRITEDGIDIYRQDFNVVEPVELWRSHDAADRQGITENHHLTGYLALWDELLRRHPGLVIDNCAGGGSRNDLESMRRALPFWRSDHCFDAVSNQSQTLGLALWLPYFGTATGPTQYTSYELRSNLSCPLGILSWDLRERGLNYDLLRRAARDWRACADNYLGDYYPLTPDSLAADAWIAWQFDRPEAGRGVVQAFRRDGNPQSGVRLRLRGLDPDANYRFTTPDDPANSRQISGRQALESGLEVAVPDQPGAAIVLYEKQIP